MTFGGRVFKTWGPATGKAQVVSGGTVGLWLDEAAGVGGVESLTNLVSRPHGPMNQGTMAHSHGEPCNHKQLEPWTSLSELTEHLVKELRVRVQ